MIIFFEMLLIFYHLLVEKCSVFVHNSSPRNCKAILSLMLIYLQVAEKILLHFLSGDKGATRRLPWTGNRCKSEGIDGRLSITLHSSSLSLIQGLTVSFPLI
jgi:hypothetical protein